MLRALPLLGSATAVVLDKAGLCSRLPYSGPLLCSPGGNSLLRGRTAQGETRKTLAHDENQNLDKMSSRIFTSHMCPTIGASAHECSALMPIFPFGYEIRVKDLSNHLRGRKSRDFFGMYHSQVLRASQDLLPTCRNISHGAGTWRNSPGSRPLRGHNPAAHHQVSGRRRPTRRHPGRLCSHLG